MRRRIANIALIFKLILQDYYTDTHFKVMAVKEIEENSVVIEDDFLAEADPEDVFETEASR